MGRFFFFLKSFSIWGLAAGAGSQTPGYTLCAQRSVSVASGLCVEIPCTFTVSGGSTLSTRVTGIWKRTTDTPDIVAASTEASMVSEGTKGRFTLTGKVQEGDCSFSISNVQPADQGEYEFQTGKGSHKYSYRCYKLRVSVTGHNGTYENKSVAVIEGDTKLLRCVVNSNPVANVSWGRGDEILNTISGQRLTLALENVSVADGVTYTCLAWNTHGSVSGTVSVTVA
ncbi:hypothetical protein XENTR_v10019552, partial [Xenopus tropicalis]